MGKDKITMTLSQTENFQHLVSVPGADHVLSPLTPVSYELFGLKAAFSCLFSLWSCSFRTL